MTASSPGPALGLCAGGHVLPAGEKSHEVGDADRLDPTASPAPAGGVQADQQMAGAPAAVGQFDGRAGGLQPGQAGAGPGRGHRCTQDRTARERGVGHQLLDRHRARELEMAADALGQRVVAAIMGSAIEPMIASARARRSVATHDLRPRRGPTVHPELLEPLLPGRDRPAQDQRQQEVVQLVGVPRPRPDLVEHLGHDGGARAGRAPTPPPGARRSRSVRDPGRPGPPGCGAPRAVRRRGR